MKAGRLILSAIIAAGCLFTAVGCKGEKSSVGNVETINFVDGDKLAEINIEGYGTIKAKLFPDLCPEGVNNFIMLAEQGYYDGLKIHRVLEDTVIQGGSLLGDGTGEKALVNEEGTFDIETDVQARHFYGALC
ncbi:MAG: peptidylprolyl isomerase, partial [Ruminococcaceae bacterium]|nr:peptidylprolyl isomerase [Oscillospiraceae bacterium]